MQHGDDAGIVYSRQPVEFFYNGNAFTFVVGAFYQVGNSVDNHQLNASILVMVFVHALYNGLQSFFA